jgi:hypothetical protein
VALKKAIITLTADSGGTAEVTTNLSGVQTVGRLRPAKLSRIDLDDSNLQGGNASYILSEGLDAGDLNPGDALDTAFVPGKELFYVSAFNGPAFNPKGVMSFYPFWNSASDTDSGDLGAGPVPLTGDFAPVFLDQPTVVSKLEGAASGDVLVVTVFYETAGDYRF